LHVKNKRSQQRGASVPPDALLLRIMDRDRGLLIMELPVFGEIGVTQEVIEDGQMTTEHLGTLAIGSKITSGEPEPIAPPPGEAIDPDAELVETGAAPKPPAAAKRAGRGKRK